MNVQRAEVTITGPRTAYLDTADLSATFKGAVSALLMTEGEVFVSLNGRDDHVRLASGTPALGATFEDSHYQRVWLRVPQSITVTVQLIIESITR